MLLFSPPLGGHARGERQVARVSPYYSVKLTDPDVYHNHDSCSAGSKVTGHNRRQGTHGYRQCEECAYLTDEMGGTGDTRGTYANEGGYSFDEPATASGT